MPLYLSIPLMLALMVLAVVVDTLTGLNGGAMIGLLGGSALWAYFDAGRIGLERYHHPFGHRTGLVMGMLLLWLVAFPWYLTVRHQIRRGTRPLRAAT
jgi:hypothetical protein